MIYPTRAAILAAAAGVPVTLLVAVLVPGRWYAGLAWPIAVLLIALVDALSGPGPSAASLRIDMPRTAPVGGPVAAGVSVMIAAARPPRCAEVALAPDPLLEMAGDGRLWLALENGSGVGAPEIVAQRRGTARIARGWVRWRGPLGLAWKLRAVPSEATVAILPDVRAVHERGARIFERHALQGLMAQIERGDGADFEALVEFQPGMDRRAIDWKQSARHLQLHAKEFRTERNSQIVFAVDAGRQMSEPVAGLPRVDRAVSAMLLNAWVALKLGDRVALHAFDARPRLATGLVTGARAFADLQHLAARIDYSGEESNYTLALTTLAARLTRRSMIVLFTEFTDLTSAEFLVRAAQRLLKTHLLLVVVLRDEELEALVDRRPDTPEDVTRAVTAAALLKERLLVLTRLRHLGAHVIEAAHDRVGDELVAGYLDLKRRNLL
ncbi:MAG: DUF58 domain-containing protein [Sphingomonas sp.]